MRMIFVMKRISLWPSALKTTTFVKKKIAMNGTLIIFYFGVSPSIVLRNQPFPEDVLSVPLYYRTLMRTKHYKPYDSISQN